MTEAEIIHCAISIGADCGVKSWMELKKLVLVSIPPNDRTNFSVRDAKTKKQRINGFERRLINDYHSQTGVMLEEL